MGLSNFNFLKKVFSKKIKVRSNGNLSVLYGSIIRSYSTDIAYFNYDLDLCIIEPQYYSATTCRHKSLIRSCRNFKNVFELNFNDINIPYYKEDIDNLMIEIIKLNIQYLERHRDSFFRLRSNKEYSHSRGYLKQILLIKNELIKFINYVDNKFHIDKNRFLTMIDNVYQSIRSNVKLYGIELYASKNELEKTKILVNQCKSVLSKIKDLIIRNKTVTLYRDFPEWNDNNDDIISEILSRNPYKAFSMLFDRYDSTLIYIGDKIIRFACECIIFEHPEIMKLEKVWNVNSYTLFKSYKDLRFLIPIIKKPKHNFIEQVSIINIRSIPIDFDDENTIKTLKKTLKTGDGDLVEVNLDYWLPLYYHKKDLIDLFEEKGIEWNKD